jgi:hypothetical protein
VPAIAPDSPTYRSGDYPGCENLAPGTPYGTTVAGPATLVADTIALLDQRVVSVWPQGAPIDQYGIVEFIQPSLI